MKDGLRVLARIDGHFYPGRLNSIKPPDIYGILLDNERGFRPHIYAREELLKSAVREVKVRTEKLAPGTRVCAYWSAKYHFLHPGTVVPFDKDSSKLNSRFVNVELDDGDSRELSLDQVRLLPINYPLVVYEDGSVLHSPGRRKNKALSPTEPVNRTKAAKRIDFNSGDEAKLAEAKPKPEGVKPKPEETHSKPKDAHSTSKDSHPKEKETVSKHETIPVLSESHKKIKAAEGLKPETSAKLEVSLKPDTPPKSCSKPAYGKKNIEVPISSGKLDIRHLDFKFPILICS